MTGAADTAGSNHATGDWPKAFLLSLYNAAIDQGHVWVRPLTATQAASLRGAFNRLRRRGDTSMAGIITPEMSLVSMGQWQALSADGASGQVPIIYNTLPSGLALPSIVGVNGQRIAPGFTEPATDLSMLEPAASPPNADMLANTEALLANPSLLEINTGDISSYVERMRRAAAGDQQ